MKSLKQIRGCARFMVMSVTAVVMLHSGAVDAASRLVCTGFTENYQNTSVNHQTTQFTNGSGCYYKDMKRYHQKSTSIPSGWFKNGDRGKSMLCGPTSSTMALTGITFGGISYYTNSWIKNKFVYRTWVERVENFARYFKNKSDTWIDVYSGTSLTQTPKFADLADGVPKAAKTKASADSTTFSSGYLAGRVMHGDVGTVHYGYYDKKCGNTFLGSEYCTFERTGGHIIALNGYYYSNSKYYPRFYDPNGGWGTSNNTKAGIRYYTAKTISSSDTTVNYFGFIFDFRPYGSRTRYLYKNSSDRYRIIDKYNGINTNW